MRLLNLNCTRLLLINSLIQLNLKLMRSLSILILFLVRESIGVILFLRERPEVLLGLLWRLTKPKYKDG